MQWDEEHDEEMQRELRRRRRRCHSRALTEQHFQDRFWRRRPDGLAVNWKDKAIFVFEFTRPDYSWDDFITRTEKRKNDRYRSYVTALIDFGVVY